MSSEAAPVVAAPASAFGPRRPRYYAGAENFAPSGLSSPAVPRRSLHPPVQGASYRSPASRGAGPVGGTARPAGVAAALPGSLRGTDGLRGGAHLGDVRVLLIAVAALRPHDMLERFSGEMRRRTWAIRILPNAAILLRLVPALAVVTYERWREEHHYLDIRIPVEAAQGKGTLGHMTSERPCLAGTPTRLLPQSAGCGLLDVIH